MENLASSCELPKKTSPASKAALLELYVNRLGGALAQEALARKSSECIHR